jgi:hypothetical protein
MVENFVMAMLVVVVLYLMLELRRTERRGGGSREGKEHTEREGEVVSVTLVHLNLIMEGREEDFICHHLHHNPPPSPPKERIEGCTIKQILVSKSSKCGKSPLLPSCPVFCHFHRHHYIK